jgi:hypothetical protein
MAQQLRNINLVAPAFKGINTEDSPIAQDPSFAEVADNAVIDKRGRIAARKGYSVSTTDKTALGSGSIRAIEEFKEAGTNKIFSVGNNKVFSGVTTLVDETPAGYTINNDNWKIVSFNDNLYFFQDSQEPLVYSNAFEVVTVDSTTGFVVGETITGGTSSTTATIKSVHSSTELYIEQTRDGTFTASETLTGGTSATTATFSSIDTGSVLKVSDVTGASSAGDIPKGNEVIGAYGRLWTADTSTNTSTVYWSDLLIGQNWTGGTSGSIDISKVWPDGYDEIVALSAHNGFLIIFGKHSIIVYQGAEAPATNLMLADTVAGVGCVDRDTVQHTGTDVIFLSDTGLRSFSRTIQEKSMPISTLSKTITKDIISLTQNESSFFRSVFSPEENFYLLTFVGQQTTYCFDVRGTLEDGSFRVTRWPGSSYTAYDRAENGTLYIGNSNGICQYTGYSDNSVKYRFKYYSPSLTFGDPTRLKLVKKIKPTLVGSNNASAFIYFGYDFETTYRATEFSIGNQTPAYFNQDEYPSYSELSSYSISSSFTSDSNGVLFANGTTGYYEVNKYLGEFSSAPTTGSGGGALLNGDSYFNTAEDKYYVYISSAFTDLSTLTPATSSEFTGGELTTQKNLNATGNGATVVVGLEADINGFALSLQEINVQALLGKTV